MKHPVLLAFVVAVVTTSALVALALAVYTPQQAPWALTAAVATFPFTWFFAWVVANAVSWWRETTGDGGADSRAQPPEAE